MKNYYIRINSDALAREAGELESCAKRAKQEIAKMSTDLTLLNSKWSGPANEEFQKNFAVDYEFFVSLCDKAVEFSGELKEAAKEYNNCENAVMDAVRRLRV